MSHDRLQILLGHPSCGVPPLDLVTNRFENRDEVLDLMETAARLIWVERHTGPADGGVLRKAAVEALAEVLGVTVAA